MRLKAGSAAALVLGAVLPTYLLAACATEPPPAAPTVSAAPPAPTFAVLSPPPALPPAPARAAAPAAAPCRTDLGPAPAYPDSAKALREAPDLFERMKLLLAARELRMAREAALTQALKACGAR